MSLFQSLAIRAAQAGKKFVTGVKTPTSSDHDIATGLNTVDHCGITFVQPKVITHDQSVAFPSSTAGSITLQHFKPTATTNPTPTDATTPWKTVQWWAIGN